MKCFIAYLSFSQNTKEIAELIHHICMSNNITAKLHDISTEIAPTRNELEQYDILYLGTFTWDQGSTPDEMKDFVADLNYKPDNVAVFGSGDTQFGGDEMYCRAVDKLVTFYNSPYVGLKIEQSPRGSQESSISHWVNQTQMLLQTI